MIKVVFWYKHKRSVISNKKNKAYSNNESPTLHSFTHFIILYIHKAAKSSFSVYKIPIHKRTLHTFFISNCSLAVAMQVTSNYNFACGKTIIPGGMLVCIKHQIISYFLFLISGIARINISNLPLNPLDLFFLVTNWLILCNDNYLL
jgi:hypothetical protein